MLERHDYPPGVPCWVDTTPPDPESATRFYASAFGWEFEDRTPAGSRGRYLVARLHDRDVAGIGSAPHTAGDPAWSTYIAVSDAALAAARVERAGGEVLVAPFDVGDAGRMAVCLDPGRARFSLWEAGSFHGAQLVNQPGTWNWSNLSTPDPEAAAGFYGAVFGWETGSVQLGGLTATMLRRPGYADHLARGDDPGIRARHAQPGVPEGFSDAIGWMTPATGPARWEVTFAVGDTDAVVARAWAGGATVEAPPRDAGPVREAVLADPWGARFTVSHYRG
jgi:predicted enzyme related to lactoylglutathione lyase